MRRFRIAVCLLNIWLLVTGALSFTALSQTQRVAKPGQVTEKTSNDKTKQDQPKTIASYSGSGPDMRIALATDASAASIGSTGEIDLQDGPSDVGWTVDADQLRFKIQQPQTIIARGPSKASYHVHVASMTDRASADRLAAKLGKKYGDDVSTEYNSSNKTYEVHAGAFATEKSADALRKQLSQDGYRDAEVITENKGSAPPAKSAPAVKVSYSDGTEVLSATKHIIISPSAKSRAPLTFNQALYRGKFEVFMNDKQQLTVINILPMEDYIRGVVPMELNVTQLEAMKAQAVAARTYALRNRGQFKNEGFDLLPTPASQAYGGLSKENELTNRAVDSTRGLVAYYDGEPINALYSSTCGGHTEDVEKIFGGPALPYLRGVSCSIEREDLGKYTITTRQRLAEEPADSNGLKLREAITLKLAGFDIKHSLTDDYLLQSASKNELRDWLDQASVIASSETVDEDSGRKIRPRKVERDIKDDLTNVSWFSHWLIELFYGDSNPGLLLSPADASYILGFQDSKQINQDRRVEVAVLLKAGILQPGPDGLLHPEKPITRERALIALARLMERPNSSVFEHGTAAASSGHVLSIRAEQKTTSTIPISENVYLFRQVGSNVYPSPSVELIGGEKILYHKNRSGEIDYLKVSPNESGASSDRYSPLSHWTEDITPSDLASRLRKSKVDIGDIVDLIPEQAGDSHRVTEVKVIGRHQTTTLTGGNKIRNAFGLRDSLFVVEKEYDNNHQVKMFHFTGRGWGHGVGMCQFGAYGLALEGYTFEQILRHYYTGITLKQAY